MQILRLILCLLCVLIVGTAGSSVAHSQDWEPNQEVSDRFEHDFERYHDKGLQFRLSLGTVYGSQTISPDSEQSRDYSGFAGSWDVALGWMVADGLSVHLSQWGQAQSDQASLLGGLGFTAYIDPANNTFVSLSLGAHTPWEDETVAVFDQLGVGAQIAFGTGWWVGQSLSSGLGLYLRGHHIDIDGDGTLASGWGVGLMWTLVGD